MADLFKKQITEWKLDGRRVPPGTPGAKKVTRESRKWYGTVNGRQVPLCRDKAAAGKMLNKLQTDAAMGAIGMGDPFVKSKKRPLRDHIDEWERDMLSRGRTEKHAATSASRVRRVVGGCSFVLITDASASRIQAYLGTLREGGMGVATVNHHLTAVKMFCRWMVKDRRMGDNPVAHLSADNARTDVRRVRRDLTADELCFLLEAARTGPVHFGIGGPDREMLYAVAIMTGLRASELASLTPLSFDLDTTPPTVTVEAGYSKHRREDVLPRHPDLVRRLRGWLPGKVAGERLWPGRWAKAFKAGKMMQRDLERARTKWIKEAPTPEEKDRREGDGTFLAYRDTEGRMADFHSLRHTFISNLARAGVNPKVAQALARHSTITLTMDRYAHVGLREIAGGVSALPSLPSQTPTEKGETPNRGSQQEALSGCTGVARTPASRGQSKSSTDRSRQEGGQGEVMPEVFTASSVSTPSQRESSGELREAPPVFEPGMADLQSTALPLG
jgi:integrase/recombinase XerD